ncbi:MAG TPA: PepSY domain-containing protein [Steroidobacteraceae bacterium]|nr:PepSY domain-containing protein [Steroidobacteraceae bacterium]
MNTQRLMLLVPLLAACGALAAPARGGRTPLQPGDFPPARAAMLTATALSIDQAVKMAEQRFHARVVKAETERDGGHTVYVLRLLDDAGRVWTVRVDAASGTVL